MKPLYSFSPQLVFWATALEIMLAICTCQTTQAQTLASDSSSSKSAAPSSELAQAQPFSVTALAKPDKVRLGEPFQYVIEIRDRPEVEYELPANLSLGPAFEVLEVKSSPQSEQPDQATSTQKEKVTRFSIQAMIFDLKEITIADLQLKAKQAGNTLQLTVHGPKITGIGNLPENQPSKLGANLPPVDVLVSHYTVIWIAGAALLLLLGSWLGIRIWKRRRSRTAKAPLAAPVFVPPHQKALQALHALQQENLPERGLAKDHFFRVSEILREYLGAHYGFLALDMTTEELLSTLSQRPAGGFPFARFESFCRQGDLVKYAKLPASVSDCALAIEEAVFIVRTVSEGNSASPKFSEAAQFDSGVEATNK